jgi:hypothetical protein
MNKDEESLPKSWKIRESYQKGKRATRKKKYLKPFDLLNLNIHDDGFIFYIG